MITGSYPGGRSVASQTSKLKQVVNEYIYSLTTCCTNDFSAIRGGRSVASSNPKLKQMVNEYIYSLTTCFIIDLKVSSGMLALGLKNLFVFVSRGLLSPKNGPKWYSELQV